MAPEEQENESDQAQQEYESRAQTQGRNEEEVDDAQDEGSSRADYSEVITVPFMNEYVERSLDLFLSSITPLSDESVEKIASDPDAVVDKGMSPQEAKGELAGQLEEDMPATWIEQAGAKAEKDHEKRVSGSNGADSTHRMDEWKAYTNSWYGFTLELPPAWQVSTQNGVTKVGSLGEGEKGMEYALVKVVYLPKSVSAQDVAQAWVKVLRATWASLEVRIIPAREMAREHEHAQIIQIEGTLSQVRMRGMFAVQVYDRLALISGFQVRSEHMQRMAPAFHRVLASFHFIKKVRRRRYIDEDERAYTGYVPVDWAVQARLRRVPTVERTPLVDFQAIDPTKTGSVAIPPTYEVYSEDALMTRDDVVGYRRVMASTTFIEELLIPRYQARKARMQVESVRSYPECSQETNRKQGQGGTLFDVAALQYTYDEAGKTYKEQIVLQIMHTPVIATWTVQMVSKRHAPVEQFEELEPFFAGILEARRSSEEWKRRERTRVEERLREAQRNLASASAGYIQAMYALSGSTKSIAENLRASIGLAKEADTPRPSTRQDEIIPLLHNGTVGADGSLYDLPVGFEMYWKDVLSFRTTDR